MGNNMIICIGVGLAMDAFAVSISNGVCVKRFSMRDGARQSLFFGIFQGLAPVIGYILGIRVKVYIEAVDHWVAFVLLGLIGGNMIVQSLKKKEAEQQKTDITNGMLCIQAMATSVDALAVGIGLAVLEVNIIVAGSMIGMITFGLCYLGSWIGIHIGGKIQSKAEFVGGIILFAIGSKILIEHLFFGG